MDSSRGDSRYNLNYSMSSIGLSLADQTDMYNNPAAVAALGRPPSGGLSQSMGGPGVGFGARSGGLLPSVTQCQSLVTSNANHAGSSGQQRGIKRAGSDCYEDHHRGVSGGLTAQTLQGLESCGAGGNGQQMDHQQQQQQAGGTVSDVPDDGYNPMQNKKSPPANGKKTKGRVKIKMEYIDNKLRRYTTFSKRKTGIMKKAYELSTLTGTQVMLLVASETGHVYTFATRKLQPMITSEAGKQLIQTCLNSPDPPSVGGGDQRMSATGFEETELSYNIADEDSKDFRLHMSSGNESEDSSDIDSPAPAVNNCKSAIGAMSTISDDVKNANAVTENASLGAVAAQNARENVQHEQESSTSTKPMSIPYNSNCATVPQAKRESSAAVAANTNDNLIYSTSNLTNIPQEVLLQLIQSGHLQLHNEEDGSGHQYVAIPLSSDTANLLKACNVRNITSAYQGSAEKEQQTNTSAQQSKVLGATGVSEMIIKQEVE